MMKVAFALLIASSSACTLDTGDDSQSTGPDATPTEELPSCADMGCNTPDTCGGYEVGTGCACRDAEGELIGECVVTEEN